MENQFCSGCGSSLPANAKFCGQCGIPVIDTQKKTDAHNTVNTNQTGQSSPSSHLSAGRDSSAVTTLIFCAMVFGCLWLSLCLIQFVFYGYIGVIPLLSHTMAGLVSGVPAGFLLLWLGDIKKKPTLNMMKKPMLIWIISWSVLMGLSLIINWFHIFVPSFNLILQIAAAGFSSFLMWMLFPQITDETTKGFQAAQIQLACGWGACGVLAIFLHNFFRSALY